VNGARHSVQRSNRVRLKADAAVLLKRVVGVLEDRMVDGTSVALLLLEIAEMKIRLHPPTGAAAPVVLTGYTPQERAAAVSSAHEPMVSVPLSTMNTIHTELACGMAFLGRGPGGTNADHIDRWAKLCSEVADGLAKADALVRPIVHPRTETGFDEDHGRIYGETYGERSVKRSHRGEGRNYVD